MAGLTVNELATQLANCSTATALHPSARAELITLEEAADAITAKLETWLIRSQRQQTKPRRANRNDNPGGDSQSAERSALEDGP